MTESRPQFSQFSQLVKSKFFYLCSFILSHPLYFSYFIFLSPYILKLLSFLSPLFITTTLLLLALFTISPSLILHNNTKGLTRKDDELEEVEEFEAYKIMFGASTIDDQENSVEFLDYASAEESETTLVLDPSCQDKEQSLTDELESTKHVIEEKTLENFFKELDGLENTTLSPIVEVKKVDKMIEKQEEEALVRNGLSKNLDSNVGIGGYGSMRKEKEWKRTLACKLFEERHNATHTNSEGMDMLWEKYEMDTTKNKAKRDLKKMKKKREHDVDEQEMDDQQLCCLQALKFSAGKMNLGIGGRPNLVKISKAFRGFGWLHHVGKNNKKVHCGDLCCSNS